MSEPTVPPSRRLYRHPSDVARLVGNLLLLAALSVAAWLAPTGFRRFGVDVVHLVDGLPASLVEGLLGVVQLVAIVVPAVVVVVLAVRRRFVLLGILTLAAAIAGVVMAILADAFVDSVPVESLGRDRYDTWLIGGQFPSSTYLCAATAVLVAGGPWLSRRWRRAGWVFLAATVAARVLTATEVPIRIAMLLTLGAAAGSLALVLFGAPRRRVDAATVTETLARAGFTVTAVTPGADDDGVPTFTARGADGEPLLVTVFGRDERDTDLLIRWWHNLTRRGLGDDAPARSPERVVEHEALALGLFRTAGVAVAAPVAVVRTHEDASVLVTDDLGGEPLADRPDAELTDARLDAIWTEVAVLQRRRLAHRRLDLDHVVVTGDAVALVDLRRADLQASDEVLGADVAELLASLATRVGVDRSVAAAVRSLTTADLARALPLVQPAVLSPTTRRAVKAAGVDLATAREQLAAAAGTETVGLAPVRRITLKGAVSLVGGIVLGYYLLSLAANWRSIFEAFGEADLAYVVPIVILTAGTYLTGAVSLLGSVTAHLALMRTTAVMFAQSFLNRFTPANAGGMAMRVRYLQLNGVETTVAAAAIGLTSAASGVAQAVLIVVFFVWGGTTDRLSDFSLPSSGVILLVVLGLGLVATVVLFTRWGRTTLRPWVTGAIGKVRGMLADVARSPQQTAMLFGGAAAGKLCNIVSFWLSVQAFGVDMSFPKAGALYLIANTVGSAVPSPGGVGGIEAALTAVLIGYGVDSATAAAIVLFFRVLTFWLPTIPGYAFLQYTQRRGIV